MNSVAVRTPSRVARVATPGLGSVIDGPWDIADLAGLAGRTVLAVLGIVVAWEGASQTVIWNDQQAWTALGIGSLVFGLTGVVGWLRAGVVRLRDLKHEVIPLLQPESVEPVASVTAVASRRGRAGRVVRGEGMSLYHRPDCIFVQGKEVRTSPPGEARRAGATPCVVCQP